MANELTCPLTGAEERLWQEKLAALLVRQIALYTANESSSVPTAAAQELLRGNTVTERFGLTLTPEQCGRLLARRAEALRETERIELGEGILPKLAVALCDSPCVGPENWEEALGGLTELFYHFKGACGERLGDDEMLAALARLYNGWAGGCADRIADLDGRAMLRFARTGRVGDDDE